MMRSHIAQLPCAAKDLVCLDERVSVNIVVECWISDKPYIVRKNKMIIWIIAIMSNRHIFMFWVLISYLHNFYHFNLEIWRFVPASCGKTHVLHSGNLFMENSNSFKQSFWNVWTSSLPRVLISKENVLIIKANKMHYFSTFFWQRTLHFSDRYNAHHQES
jgi:hypothetical protein